MNSSDMASKLNEAISIELGGVLQYNQYSHVLLGPERRVWQAFFHEQSMASLAHAQRFAAKVVALGGTPALQPRPVAETTDLTEMLQNSLALEQQAVAVYTEALAIADDNAGYRSLLEEQIREEMDRVEELQKYLGQVEPVPAGMAIGMNLAGMAYWQPYWIYNDALRNWGEFFEPGGTSNVQWDSSGYPNSLNGSIVRANLAMDMAHRPASFTLTFTGVGTVAVDGVQHTSSNAGAAYSAVVNPSQSLAPIVVEIRSMPDPAHPVRNVHLYMPRPGGGYYTGGESHPFHDDFVALINPFRVIRFMDTGQTNFSNVETWAHRTPDGWQFHAHGGKNSGDLSGHITTATVVPIGTRLPIWGNIDWDIARCTTSAPHGLKTGQMIKINENGFVSPDDHVMAAVVSSTQFEVGVAWNFGTKSGSFPWWMDRRSGMSYEDMCRLCNVCQADAWVCIPWFADDDYVQNMAGVIKATLATNRKVYVELSNEVWNGGFPHYRAAVAMSTAGSAHQAYADRATAKLNLFRSTFAADSRIVRVFSGQHANPAVAEAILAELAPGDLDAFAIAPYMTPAYPDPLTAEQLAINVLAAVNDPWWYDNIVAHRTMLATFSPSARLICYEGGQHAHLASQDSIVQAAMVRPEMQEAYEVCLEKAEQAGIDLICFFNMGSGLGRGMAFSHLPWMDVDPNTYPRYKVLVDAA